MARVATSVESVPISYVGEPGLLRRKLVALAAMLVLLFAGMVATAPTAWAAYCGHSDHTHWHNAHMDYYHFHQEWNDGGVHYHTWHNHTHGDVFTVICS